MALAGLLAGAAESHTLIEQAVVADLGGFAYHDAHAVVDDEALADFGAGVDLDARLVPRALGDVAREEFVVVLVAPVRYLVVLRCPYARVQQQYLQGAARGGVAGFVGGDGLSQVVEHFSFLLIK